ncbi:MAG TPA: hypothetical protein VGL48_05155 [Acidimicrobiales bacterium]
MTTPAMAEMAGRLEGMVDELTDMAIDALRRATSGDPDAAEAGEALALEKRIVRARRSLEKAVVALAPPAADGLVDDGAG